MRRLMAAAGVLTTDEGGRGELSLRKCRRCSFTGSILCPTKLPREAYHETLNAAIDFHLSVSLSLPPSLPVCLSVCVCLDLMQHVINQLGCLDMCPSACLS